MISAEQAGFLTKIGEATVQKEAFSFLEDEIFPKLEEEIILRAEKGLTEASVVAPFPGRFSIGLMREFFYKRCSELGYNSATVENGAPGLYIGDEPRIFRVKW